MDDDIDDAVLDELYSAPRAEFIALRTANAKQARADGERELASRITALRKPSMAAWLLNRIAREHRADLDAAFETGERLRAAHRELDGAQLRALSTERHQVLDTLLADAKTIAESAGQHLSDAAEEQLRATIDAALRDPDIAKRVSTGLLDSAVLDNETWPAIEFTGQPTPSGNPYTNSRPENVAQQAKRPDPAERQKARERAAAAAEAEQQANHALHEAQQLAAKTSAAVSALRAELAEAKRAEQQAQQQVTRAEQTLEQATGESAAAHQALTELE